MKKILNVLLSVLLVAGLVACGNSNTNNQNNSSTNNSQTSNTNTATPTPTPTPEPVNSDVWVVGYYVDEFNEPTDERYVTNIENIVGKFSNSATTDSNLVVQFAIDNDYVCIFLYEYGRNLVKNNGRYDDEFTVTLRSENGNQVELNGAIYPGGDRVIITGKDKDTFISYLSGNDDFKVLIVNDEYTTSTYLFKVSPSNFAKIY